MTRLRQRLRSTVSDADSRIDTFIVYRPVWKYLLDEPVESAPKPAEPEVKAQAYSGAQKHLDWHTGTLIKCDLQIG